MARYTGPIARLARREGIPVDGSDKTARILKKKAYPPGEQGNKMSFGKPSNYAIQLREKQKAKRVYGILEKQFRKYYKMGDSKEGRTGENMFKIIETRLDNVVYRAGFAATRRQARQMVVHGHFNLNGKRSNTPSILVKAGDKIEVREKSKNTPLFAELAKAKDSSAKWLKVDLKKMTIEVSNLPETTDLEQAINNQLIVEFYSK